jgi:hypothetical protein
MTVQSASVYPARLEVDYPDQHNRVTTFFRVFMVIPIGIVLTPRGRRVVLVAHVRCAFCSVRAADLGAAALSAVCLLVPVDGLGDSEACPWR